MRLDQLSCENLMKIIKNDSEWLMSFGIMDYSLLVGIESVTVNMSLTSLQNRQTEIQSHTFSRKIRLQDMLDVSDLIEATEQNQKTKLQVYHFGIIDYLQLWNLNKKCERITKSLLHGKVYNTQSSVPPAEYQKRFVSFLEQ